jgi:hypothetical protein
VLPETLAVGIDPILNSLQPVNPSAKFFPLTSDEFFEKHDLGVVLNGRPLDLAFIDGMHLFEFILRDFTNLERYCSRASVVLVHDCYPADREMATREPSPNAQEAGWSGDVWKLIMCLKQYRPDLRVSVVDSPPTGLGVITGLDPYSSVLKDHYEEICGIFVDLDFSVLNSSKEEKLNFVPGGWDAVRKLLSSVSGERPRPRSTQPSR